jgi:2-polyprenyl-3-methyl-5-hydroxy-6-metoxy-1,4-benzoquinol methylase
MSPVPIRISAVLLGNKPGIDPAACVEALLAGSIAPQEIVLVTQQGGAGYPKQDTEQVMVSHEQVHDGATWAESCKLGLDRATGELIAVLDADCEVSPNWVELLTSFLVAHPDTAAVEGKRCLHVDDATSSDPSICAGPIKVDAQTLAWSAQSDGIDRTQEVACLSRTAFLLRRAALQELGGNPLDCRFQTELAANDLFARLLERSWHLYYIGQAEVRCAESNTWAHAMGKGAIHPRELLLFAWKHLSVEQRDQQMALLSRQANPGLRALFSPASPPMLAAREALAWLREHKRELAAERERSSARGGAFQAAVEAAQARAGYSFYPRQDVLDLVPAGAKVVVDVGCASGILGATLKRQRPGIQVRGVEISSEAAARAREILDDVYCGSVESPVPSSWPRPDCVIFADVLEHLPDPWSVLRRYRAILGTGGKVVVSVPNIGHRSVVEGLLHGRFEYVDAGILDRTHLRFFTRASAIDLLESTGFKVEQIRRNLDSATQPRWLRVANRLGVLSAFLEDVQAVQFIIVATVSEPE